MSSEVIHSSLLTLHYRWIPRCARNDKQVAEQYSAEQDSNIERTYLSTQPIEILRFSSRESIIFCVALFISIINCFNFEPTRRTQP